MVRPSDEKAARTADLEFRLRLKDLQLLVAIDEQRSISAAAESLGVAQPAASRSLMELEQTLSTHLFERDRTRGMSPTPAGQIVLAHARTMLADCRLMQVRLAAQRSGVGVHLRLGVIPFSPSAMVDHLIATLTRPPANMTLTISEASSTELVRELQMQRLDAAVTRSPASGLPPDLSQEMLLRQEACLIVHPRSPLAAKDTINARDLAGMRWLLPARGTPTRLFIDEAFTAAGVPPPSPVVEAGTNRIVHGAVRASRDMIAVAPADVGRELEALGGVTSLPWRRLSLSRPLKFPAIALLYPTRHRDTPHIQLLLGQLRAFVGKPRPI